MKEYHTEDKFLGGKLLLRQPLKGFRAGSDGVLLASLVPESVTGSLLDVGAGTGVISLCLAKRLQQAAVTGLDCQEDLVTLAQENAAINGLDQRTQFILADILSSPNACPQGLAPQTFDHVISNPPYFQNSTPSPDPQRAVSRSYQEGSLEQWISFCLRMLKPRGHLYLIYPTEVLQLLLQVFGKRVGALEIYPLWPFDQAPNAKRFLIKARKGVATPSKLCRGIVLHTPEGAYGAYTKAAHRILWEGRSFEEAIS